MATRMQQRRGTALQWSNANPILNAGEIGFETDTNKFKIGDGTNHWTSLSYFVDANTLIDGAPGLLDTLNELAAAIGDDPAFFTTVATNLSNHESDTTNVHGIANTADLATKTYADGAVSTHSSDTTSVHGITDTAELATKTFAAELLTNATKTNIVITGNKDGLTITAENGVADSTTDNLTEGSTNKYFTDERAQDAVGLNVGTGLTYTDSIGEIKVTPNTYDAYGSASTVAGNLSNHESDTTNIHGITDTSKLVTTDGSQTLTGKTISAADNTVTINVSDIIDVTASASELNVLDGITASTAELNILDGVTASTAEINTLDGITASTAELNLLDGVTGVIATEEYVDGAVSGATVDQSTLAGSGLSWNLTNEQFDVDTTVIAELASPTFTGTVTVDDLEIGGSLTFTGTATEINQTDLTLEDPIIYLAEGNPANINDIGFVGAMNDGTYQHVGLVRDASAGTWKLFKGVTDEPTTTVNFAQGSLDDIAVGGITASSITVGDVSNTEFGYLNGVTSAIQTQLNDKAPLASPTFTGTVTLPSGTVTSSMIANGTIVDEDISASAAIAASKISGTAVTQADTGTVTNTMLAGSIANNKLSNSKVTVGTTDINLGASSTTLSGLTSVTSTSFVGALTGNADTVTNGVYTTGTYSNPTWITGLAWSKISSTPTTVSGYGITDGVSTGGSYSDPSWLTISKSKVGLGNVENTALSTWAGSSNITTLGTISTGTWSADTIALNKGGTGATTQAGAANAVLPSQASANGKYLTSDGTNVSWGTVSSYSAPTLGSTSIGSGATVTTITGLTLSNSTLSGTVTANSSAGTSGQVLTSTGSGVQWSTPAAGAAFSELLLIGA